MENDLPRYLRTKVVDLVLQSADTAEGRFDLQSH